MERNQVTPKRRHVFGTLQSGTHYPHVTWAHVMIRVQLGCVRRFTIEFYGADSHFCHSAYVTWYHLPARLSHFCCRTHFVRWAHVTWGVCVPGLIVALCNSANAPTNCAEMHGTSRRSGTLIHEHLPLCAQIASGVTPITAWRMCSVFPRGSSNEPKHSYV